MTNVLVLPRLVAGRDFADDMVRTNLGSVIDAEVTVDASRLMSGTPSFAAQLVRSIVTDGKAASLRLIGGPSTFASYVTDAARALTVSDQVSASDRVSDLAVR